MEIILNQKRFRTPERYSMGCQKKILKLQEKLDGVDFEDLTVDDYEVLQEMACVLLNDKSFEKRNPCLVTLWLLDEYGDDETWAVFLKSILNEEENSKKKLMNL